jgi:hypothetical protein
MHTMLIKVTLSKSFRKTLRASPTVHWKVACKPVLDEAIKWVWVHQFIVGYWGFERHVKQRKDYC